MVLLGWIALLVAVGLIARWVGAKPQGVVAAIAWLSLPIYNRLLLAGCPGDCAIRVDLLIVIPVLVSVTVWWLLAKWRLRKNRRL